MRFKDLLFLVEYSFKDILMDIIEFLKSFKNPKTWSFILYAALFLIAYYRKLTVINTIIIISLILLIYVARQRKDPEFYKAIKEKAFLINEEDKIREYYESYKKQCFFMVPRKEPLSYDDYKQQELKKIQKKTEINPI